MAQEEQSAASGSVGDPEIPKESSEPVRPAEGTKEMMVLIFNDQDRLNQLLSQCESLWATIISYTIQLQLAKDVLGAEELVYVNTTLEWKINFQLSIREVTVAYHYLLPLCRQLQSRLTNLFT